MSDSIHAHDVMRMIDNSDASWTYASLMAAIHERFGENTRFHCCFARDMSARDLIEQLKSRQQYLSDNVLAEAEGMKVCGHEKRIQSVLKNLD